MTDRLLIYTMNKYKLQHQKDLNGCGIACLSNLLDKPYDQIKRDFEHKFYSIERGIKVSDLLSYLKMRNFEYKSKFFNQNRKYEFNKKDADKFSRITGSITLIVKSDKYPVGHYLLRVKNGWIDPWYNLPSIDNVHARIRKKLPDNPWYVIYPQFTDQAID